MANVHDVAAYILRKMGPITAMKLQKLAYYCQAWHLVWEEKPLFNARIEAWANGPVVVELYNRHKGSFEVATWRGDAESVSENEAKHIDEVLDYYGKYTAQQLSVASHSEEPWIEARRGLHPGERGSRQITTAMMHEYYSGL